MSDNNYAIFLILSEILITAVVFIGAYLIFRPLLSKKKDKDSDENNDS